MGRGTPVSTRSVGESSAKVSFEEALGCEGLILDAAVRGGKNGGVPPSPSRLRKEHPMRVLACLSPLGLLVAALVLSPSAFGQTDPDLLAKYAEKNELLDAAFIKLLRNAESKFASREFDAAIGLAQNALNKRPSSGRATALVGYAYKAKKLYGQAIPYLQKAAGLFDDKTEFFEKGQALYNVAFTYELMRQRDAAIGAWQTYLGFASNYPQEAQGVTFARERIAALQSVKR